MAKPKLKHKHTRPLIHETAFRLHLERHDAYFSSLPLRQRAALTGYLQGAIFRRHRHSLDDDQQVLHWRQRWLAFRGKFGAVNKVLDWFEEGTRFSPGNWAGGWHLTDKGRAMIEHYLQSAHASIVPGFEDETGRPVRMPRAAISTLTQSGKKTRFRGASIRAAVEVNGEALHGFDAACAAWLAGNPCPAGYEWAFKEWRRVAGDTGPNGGIDKATKRVKEARWQAGWIELQAKCSNVPELVLPQTYVEANSGRLYAEGHVTLQNCPREVKRAALKGCWEYDFENAHWSLLRQMAPGVKLPAVDAYLANKKRYREDIADDAGISEKDAKTCIIALIYGASITDDPARAIPKEIGVEAATRLRKCKLMHSLWTDVKAARNVILSRYEARTRQKHRTAGLVNDAGRAFNSAGIPREKLKASKLSHILQGAESEALRACMDVAGPALVLLQHDGFTAREQLDKAALIDAIFSRLGFNLDLSEEQL